MVSYEHKIRNIYLGEYSPYQEVEYIESSWSWNTWQHINTWYIVSNNTKVQFKISDWGQRTWQIFWVANTWASWWKCFSIVFDAYTFNNVYNLAHWFNDWAVHIWELSQEWLYKDWTKLSTPSATTFTSDWPLAIFCINYQWGSWFVEHVSNRLYFFKIYEWENLVRDFIPCYRISDDVIWLYDKVNNVFYTNSWTWTFTKWPDV